MRTYLCLTTSLCALIAGASFSAGYAAETPGTPEVDVQLAQGQQGAASAFEEITVTARRREENLQIVPIAVTAFSANDLEDKNVKTLADLQFVAPSVSVQPSQFRQDTLNITIRGLRNFPSQGVQFDTAASVYVNGVYFARSSGLTGALFDIDNVQVLKGPQGTLVGRNSTGGAVLYTTREPTDNFEGSVSVTGGDYGRRESQVILNVPFSESIAVRTAFSFNQTDGYIKNIFFNPTTGERNDTPGFGSRKLSGLFSVKFQPDDTFKLVLRGDFDVEHHTGVMYHSISMFEGTVRSTGALGTNPTPVSRPSICNIPLSCNQFTDGRGRGRVSGPYYSNPDTKVVNTSPLAYNTSIASLLRVQDDWWSADQAENAYSNGYFQTVSGSADKTFGDINVRLVAGYRWFDTLNTGSVARGAPYTTFAGFGADKYDAKTADLTVNGNAFDNNLKWTAGAFYFNESSEEDSEGGLLGSVNQSGAQPIAGRQFSYGQTISTGENTSYAPYLQATYSVMPQLRVTGGIRYSIDKRESYTSARTNRMPATPTTSAAVRNGVHNTGTFTIFGIPYTGYTSVCTLTDAAGVTLPLNACERSITRTFKKETWSLSVDYDLWDRTLVYATTRKGYRSGAINTNASNPAATVALPESRCRDAPPHQAAFKQTQAVHQCHAHDGQNGNHDEVGSHTETVTVYRQQPAQAGDGSVKLGDDCIDQRQ